MSIVHRDAPTRRVGGAASFVFGVVAWCAAPVAAQDPTPDPVPDPAPASATVQVVTYGRIEQAGTALRCFPTAISPVYAETLAEGDVVVLDEATQNGFRSARLPLGPIGYVHERFVDVGEDGNVTAKGSQVAFRYRPNSREAPVRAVEAGTTFKLLAVEGEWLKVRFAEQPVWIPATACVVFPGDSAADTVVAAWKSHGERQSAQVAEAVAAIRDAKVAEALLATQREDLVALRQRFRDELAKADSEQALDPIESTAKELVAAIAADTAEQRDATALLAQIQQQQEALKLVRFVREEPVRTTPTVVAEPVERDPLEELATGWLHVSGGLFTPKRYTIEKGGQVLLKLTCTTGRYSLDVFEGMEIGVRGPVGRPTDESIRHLDVQHLEVLSRRPR